MWAIFIGCWLTIETIHSRKTGWWITLFKWKSRLLALEFLQEKICIKIKSNPCPALMAGVSLWALSAGTATAQCAPDPAMDGDEVICAGVDFNGFTSSADSIDFSVMAGAGIFVGNQQAVVITGNSSSFENNGLIRAGAGTFSTIDGLVQLGNITPINSDDAPSITGENFGQIIVVRNNSSTGFFHPAVDVGANVASFINRPGALIENQFRGTAVYLNSEFSQTFVNSRQLLSAGLAVLV
jgi:hypothetical protein